ncbi:protein translocase subunit SecDF [Flavobacteriales bacterium]|nr:protein translocase subunit SecDF [Flavobacteriales bacterium]
MQNRTIIWVFTILLSLACLYQLSFTWVTSGVESSANSFATAEASQFLNADGTAFGDSSIIKVGNKVFPVSTSEEVSTYKTAVAENYLVEKANQPAYPIFGQTYKECKDNELAKGLDLEGGMSVTLEVSIPDMVKNLAGRYAKKPSFTKPYDAAYTAFTSNGNDRQFVDLFEEKYNEISGGENLANDFKFKNDNGEKLTNISNEEVFVILREKAISALDKTETVISSRVSGLGLSQPTIQKNKSKGTITIELPGVKDKERARKLLQSTAQLEFWETYNNTEVGNGIYEKVNDILSRTMYPGYLDSVEKALADTNDIKDSTINESEFNEGDTTDMFDDSSTEFNPTADLTEEEQVDVFRKTSPLSAYLYPNANRENQWNEGPVLGYAKLTDTAIIDSFLNQSYVQNELNAISRDLIFMWESKSTFSTTEGTPLLNLYLVKKTKSGIPALDGEEVENARQDFDPINRKPMVTLQFKSAGAIAWGELTEASFKQNTGIAITLDNKVFSAPIASGKIDGGNTQITGGSFAGANGIAEAADLANILKAGALPAPAKIVDESIVGPTLGAENVSAGLWSFAGALLLVLLYMIFYYAKAGAVADIALIANIFFIFGTLASLGAALTLPGIAGIVLTIGMSVDANVLVFERIREELRNGKGKRQAIDEGYAKALSAILDANVTTLLTAIVLGYFGTGAIQGFAVTLIIGIFTSLFSALIISRLIFSYMTERKKEISFSTSITKNLFLNLKIPFIKKRKMFYIISAIIIAGGIFSMVQRSLDYGVEFTGGRTYKVKFEKAVNLQDVRNSLSVAFGDEPEVKMIDNEYKALVTTQFMLSDKSANGSSIVESKLAEGLNPISSYEILESRQVDPQISSEFKSSSIYAIIFSLIIIFLYIVFRFRKWQFGLGALIAMAHDVLIVLSLFSIGWGRFPFAMEINQAFIAAILTVVGYSINDTVVVFDRIREFLTEKSRDDSSEVINKALNSTLSRTVNTSVTTFLVLLIIFIFGGDSIKGMTFALMIGVVVGTYSSLCIATPTVVDFTKKFDFKKKIK